MRFIDSEKARHPVACLCLHLGVKRSTFYAWKKRKPSSRSLENTRAVARIRELHLAKKERYGSPRIHAELVAKGIKLGRGRVARLMRENGIRANRKRPFRVMTTDSNHGLAVAPNLLERNFMATQRNEVWVGDITYVRTDQGWLYVAVLLDLFSRRVVGHACSAKLTSSIAERALRRAVERRVPAPGVVHHTDRGIQYACASYQKLLKQWGFQASMSRKGNCLDNAVAESFFSTLKAELVANSTFSSRAQAARSISDYIEKFYNEDRLHSTLGYVSPVRFEQLAVAA